tara:strand:+ start:2314 stop:3069 length:756 start_codon:yes stop_codon:yes gene_type:complete
MGNLLSAQANENRQRTLNEVYQTSDQTCQATCVNVQSGNTIFLDGTVSGDITFKQECSVDATCMMDNTIEQVLESLQESQQQNATEASMFGGGFNIGTVNLNLSDQEIENQVRQALNTVCRADVNNLQENNMVYARNSNTGDITFEQSGNAEADCLMTNMAIAKANLSQANVQSNTTAATMGAFGTVIFIIIALAVGLWLFRSLNKSDQENQPQGPPPGQEGQGQNGKKSQGGQPNYQALAAAYMNQGKSQ